MKTLPLFAALAFAAPAMANDFAPAMEKYLAEQISPWANDPMILDALRAQNARTSGYAPAEIDALDKAWRAEVGKASTPTIDPVITGVIADMLRNQVESSGGAITEIFVMDAVGLNVAASHVTSDMWQGDEEKWSETYPKGKGATHFGDVELDESSQRYQGQISIAITDPATGETLGAMTVGVDAESLL